MNIKNQFNAYKSIAFAVGIFFTLNAHALIVLQQFSVPLGVEFDNNATLSADVKKSIWRYTASPKYSIAVVDEKNRWSSNIGLNIVRTSNTKVTDNRQDPNLNISWNRELENGNFNISSGYSRTSSRFREFKRTGFVDADGTSVSKFLSATWNRALTNRLDFLLGANITKNNNSGGSTLVKSSLKKSINTSLTYALTDRMSPFVQYGYTKFEPNGLGARKNNSQNYIAGVRYAFNPQLSGTISAGINHLSTAGNGKLFNAGLDYMSELYTVNLGLSRNVTPSDLGQFEESDSFNANYNYLLTDKSSFGLNFDISKSKSADSRLGGAGQSNDTTGMRLGASYTKELSEYWQMKLSFDERRNNSSIQHANGETIGIFFTYNTPEF